MAEFVSVTLNNGATITEGNALAVKDAGGEMNVFFVVKNNLGQLIGYTFDRPREGADSQIMLYPGHPALESGLQKVWPGLRETRDYTAGWSRSNIRAQTVTWERTAPKIRLNDEYTAIISENGKRVLVGCQNFPAATILEVADTLRKYRVEIGLDKPETLDKKPVSE
jgi:hypothetical protein